VEALETRLVPASLFVWNQTATPAVWSNPANWLVGGAVPAAAPAYLDSVKFTATKNVDSTDEIGSLTVQDFTIDGYTSTITLGTSLVVQGTFTFSTLATVDVGTRVLYVGNADAAGSFVWNAGTLKGDLLLDKTGTTTTINSAPVKTLDGGVITNFGTITWTTDAANGDIVLKKNGVSSFFGRQTDGK